MAPEERSARAKKAGHGRGEEADGREAGEGAWGEAVQESGVMIFALCRTL
jgi:hypothetical protein